MYILKFMDERVSAKGVLITTSAKQKFIITVGPAGTPGSRFPGEGGSRAHHIKFKNGL